MDELSQGEKADIASIHTCHSQKLVTGRIHDIGAAYVSSKESDRRTTRVRVDNHTQMGRVAVGDQVKPCASEDGLS
ncbi:MAG: hypothetical protein NTAFB01_00110 [Nitrospira sp.]